MLQGVIKFYNEEKGFGFIIPGGTPGDTQGGAEDMFFHVTQCVEGYEPQEGDSVTYEVTNGRDGRPAAANVAPAEFAATDDEVAPGASEYAEEEVQTQEEEEYQEEGQQ